MIIEYLPNIGSDSKPRDPTILNTKKIERFISLLDVASQLKLLTGRRKTFNVTTFALLDSGKDGRIDGPIVIHSTNSEWLPSLELSSHC